MFFFPCKECGRQRFLFRGMCDICDPELHAAYRRGLETMEVADLEYHYDTGREPLDDWFAFEDWCKAKGIS